MNSAQISVKPSGETCYGGTTVPFPAGAMDGPPGV
jgi:hypothetical protein